eukprot:TRINITY_DN9937_c0_g1_i1.p1 TRINITY_DN9937_c0_g1~~TRINITY_DN9937_c0_g1_i1.p1  ORF type:complete len:129 (+),score=17.58 TRINITY_DN9937_c0_g1_i1:215-601(+)
MLEVSGLMAMYDAEVLQQLPIMQTIRFGSIFAADWHSTRAAPHEQAQSTPFDESWPESESLDERSSERCATSSEVHLTGVAPWRDGFQAPRLSLRHYFNNFPLVSPRKPHSHNFLYCLLYTSPSPRDS